MIYSIVNAAMSLVTVWIVFKYSKLSFDIKISQKWWSVILWVIFYVFQLYVESQKGEASLVIFFLNISFVLLIFMSEYKGTIRIKVIKTTYLYVMWMLIEYVVDACMHLAKINEKESLFVGSVLSKIIMIVLLQVLNRKNQKSNRKIPWNYWLILFTMPVGSIYIAYIIYLSKRVNLEYMENFSLVAFVILIFMNITIFEVYDKLASSLEIENENKIFEQRFILLAKSNEEKNKIYDEFREQQHDYINQFVAVKSDIQQGNNEEAIKLLDNLLNTCTDNIDIISQSGNDIIDSIINYKYSIARKAGIDFNVQIFIPESLPFDQRDLCIIIGNALDNAIEAAKFSTFPFVELFLGIKKGAFVAVIKNSFVGNLKRDSDGKLLTTKSEKKSHGYGFSSIKKTVEKYHGQVIWEEENQVKGDKYFILTLILGINNVEL